MSRRNTYGKILMLRTSSRSRAPDGAEKRSRTRSRFGRRCGRGYTRARATGFDHVYDNATLTALTLARKRAAGTVERARWDPTSVFGDPVPGRRVSGGQYRGGGNGTGPRSSFHRVSSACAPRSIPVPERHARGYACVRTYADRCAVAVTVRKTDRTLFAKPVRPTSGAGCLRLVCGAPREIERAIVGRAIVEKQK